MKQLTIKFGVAVLTFLIGVTFTMLWFTTHHAPTELVRVQKEINISPLEVAIRVARSYDHDASYSLAEIAVRYAKIGQFDKAILLANEVENRDERAVGLLKIAVEYWNDGEKDKALEIFNTIAETPATSYRQYTLGLMAKQYAAAKQYERVFEIASIKMQDSYHVSVALEAIVDTFDVTRDNLDVLASLIQRLGKPCDVDDKSRILTKITVKYAEAGQYDYALRLAHKMGRATSKNEVDNFDRDNALQKIALILADAGQYDRAIQVVNPAENYFKDKALIEIAGKLIAAGQKGKALEILSQVLRPLLKDIDKEYDDAGYRARRVSEVAVKYGQAESKDKAAKLLEKALKSAKAVRKFTERDDALHEVAISYAEIGLYDEAIQVAQTNNFEYSKIKPLADIGVEMVRAGSDNQVGQVVKAIQAAHLDDRAELKADGLLAIADAYLKAGQRDAAVNLLSIGFDIARSASFNEAQPIVMGNIAVKYAEAGEYERAFEVIREIKEKFYKVFALADIGVLQAEKGQELSEESKSLLREIKE